MILDLSAKCSDLCSTRLLNDAGDIVLNANGEAPHGLGIGGGDYVRLKIDLSTGQIVGFKPMTDQEVLEALGEAVEEDDQY